MVYKVINAFTDTQDNNRRYKVGDEFLQGNSKPTKKRLEELSNKHPKYKRAFIEEVKEKSSGRAKNSEKE
ncbi:hypothetical protein FZC79_10455 [Rossellomorea vietnamensis]|uniref:Uncharacterized protein n=1 Tax=Rossellomorea vietnamensis TaxID=218284 RepID=A0A5D4KFC9_9BACI|nr:hypothetical protein [Rossellomorea vietnamensis]TYR75579.1 hypothetical protein FZC79_10455 [Rossellomorea vietnamensis]